MLPRRPALATVAALSLALVLGGCSEGSGDPEPTPEATATGPTRTATPEPAQLRLGVYGSEPELAGWSSVASDFNATANSAEVDLVEWKDRESAMAAVREGDVPDVFMVNRQDLDYLLEEGLTRPVSELLDERGVDFGDDFSRDAVESFSFDGELQCMAYSVSPMVMYVNEDLIDFDKMERRGFDVPSRWDRWSLAEFEAAADFAARPARGTSGFWIEPSVHGLAPFVESGGGSVFDDAESPTTLNFSDDDSRAALEQSLAVLRDASLTLTDEQLAKRPALEWFKRGKLGMIAGYRDLVPELRQVPNLNFNVMSMPTVESAATVGEVTGLCISSTSKHPAAAADLIAHAVSEESTREVVKAGGMVPANLAVAGSEEFLQTARQPKRSRVFNTAVRGMTIDPLLHSWPELEQAVAPWMVELLTAPGDLDLEAVTEQIDEASRTVLDPEETESVSPEAEPGSGSESGSASPSPSSSASPSGKPGARGSKKDAPQGS